MNKKGRILVYIIIILFIIVSTIISLTMYIRDNIELKGINEKETVFFYDQKIANKYVNKNIKYNQNNCFYIDKQEEFFNTKILNYGYIEESKCNELVKKHLIFLDKGTKSIGQYKITKILENEKEINFPIDDLSKYNSLDIYYSKSISHNNDINIKETIIEKQGVINTVSISYIN